VVAAANRRRCWKRRLWLCTSCCTLCVNPHFAGAAESEMSEQAILGESNDGPSLRLVSISTRITAIQQNGRGFQSKAGPRKGPGSERLTVFEPQLEVVMKQGEDLTHRLWIPVDIVTAASPNAIDRDAPDVTSQASRQNKAATLDWTTQYRATQDLDISIRSGIHVEEEWRAWHAGLTLSHAFAEHNTVLSLGVFSVFDWFDRYALTGQRIGLARRSSNTVSGTLTQVLSRSTIAEVNYGVTLQAGELGNSWNIVPMKDGEASSELLPSERLRHAFVSRITQALPTQTFLKGYYRFYTDTWSVLAHTLELQILQRITPAVDLGLGYRHHDQAGATFFTERATGLESRRTADSDLQDLSSNSVSGKIALALPWGSARQLHVDIGAEHYWRTNNLEANAATCSIGLSF
jgi:Protein of unknown function (DUF3570)